MKVRCIYRLRFLKYLGIQAITLYPWILFLDSKEKVSEELLRHELAHITQVEETGFLRFYFLYLKFYLQNRRKGLCHRQAYLDIPFEIEARAKEKLLS